MLTFLLDIKKESQILQDPLVGSLFENLVVVEAMKAMTHRGQRPNFNFYRDNHREEIDLLFTHENRRIGIEIKSAATLQASLMRTLNKLDEKVIPLDEKYLVYSGAETRRYSSAVTAINFKSTFEILTSRLFQT